MYSDNPQPCTRRSRVFDSNARASSGGSGADETIRRRSVGTFSCVTPAASSKGKSVGTTLEIRTDSRRMISLQANGSSRSVKTRWPPVESAVIRPNPNACA